ncbi:hypothetical protein AGMMS50233_11170 [Endomicrobiia bacterium]|nr:hypothetical protein AGMMS50233_11170 [Endomicrobiia bacterium]
MTKRSQPPCVTLSEASCDCKTFRGKPKGELAKGFGVVVDI